MKFLVISPQEAVRKENICIPLFQNDPLDKEEFFTLLSKPVQSMLLEFARSDFKGEEGETTLLWNGACLPRRIMLVGLGERAKWNERKHHLLSRRFVQFARAHRLPEFASMLPSFLPHDRKQAAILFGTNAMMGAFEFTKYKSEQKKDVPELKTIYLGVPRRDQSAVDVGLSESLILGEETNLCRELANTPGSEMTPTLLAAAAGVCARRTGMRITVLGVKEIEKLGMGGVLGVGKGSSEKPKFIILEYLKGSKNQKLLVLAGKGVTFDTGGINLKPDTHILDMHMDMSGGAAVIHGMAAVAQLKLPINVVGLIPAVENMPSGSSYRPGDLLKSLSGKVIEVLNTDAEGRIILADALTYGLRYKPEIMIDFATLTGAAHVALGSHCSAVFSNDERLLEGLISIGNHSGDYVWPLPLWDEYLPEIKGQFGDLANVGRTDRYGGAIHGAKFLEQFAGNTRFAHIDIAPRMTTVEGEFLAKGASGVGVRFIVELAKEYHKL